MLLRRITEHVKAQNWFAVGLDFFIVVVGVLLAFQITAWSDDRAADQRRAAAIERLHDESQQIISYFNARIGFIGGANDARADLIEAMLDGTWESFEKPEQISSLLQISLAPSATPPRTAYDELVSTGLFAGIGDPDLRETIAGYYAQLDFLQGQIAYQRTILSDFGQWQGEGVKLVFNRDFVSHRERVYDLESLSGDEAFMQYLIEGHGIQKNGARFWGGALAAAEDMCMELARFSGGPCAALEGVE